ncbi:hypothetical protein HOD08_03295 [bacterium]|nr:hypothetical protein [bacterium]
MRESLRPVKIAILIAAFASGTNSIASPPVEIQKASKPHMLSSNKAVLLSFLPKCFMTDDIIEELAFGIAEAQTEYFIFFGLKTLERLKKLLAFMRGYIKFLDFILSGKFDRLSAVVSDIARIVGDIIEGALKMTPEQLEALLSEPELFLEALLNPSAMEELVQMQAFLNHNQQYMEIIQAAQAEFFQSEEFKNIVAKGMEEYNRIKRGGTAASGDKPQWLYEMANLTATNLMQQQQEKADVAKIVAKNLVEGGYIQ